MKTLREVIESLQEFGLKNDAMEWKCCTLNCMDEEVDIEISTLESEGRKIFL